MRNDPAAVDDFSLIFFTGESRKTWAVAAAAAALQTEIKGEVWSSVAAAEYEILTTSQTNEC